jgi:pyruvate dehydrogenase E2 component (dihydrolipoamide acetyltransferase)
MAFSVVMPALEMAQETGKLIAWRKKEGESVTKGELLLEIETDKAIMEIEAPADGVLAGVKAHEGAVVPVGQTIAWIVRPGEAPPPEENSAAFAAMKPASTPKASVVVEHTSTGRAPISPKARRLAKERGVDLSQLQGSGPGGEILASDILAAGTSAPASVKPPELSSVARLMAERTAQSWTTVPHFFLVRDVDAGALNDAREKLKPGIEAATGVKLTHTDLLVALVAAALRKNPRMNASWTGSGIQLHPDVNIAIAIAVEDGVVAPVILRADQTKLSEIALQRRDLAERAKAGRLRPQDISGATFTISNLGMYDVDGFQAIITAPQAGILAVGRIADRVVPANGQPGIRPMLTVTLSVDHRVAGGAQAATFLKDVVEALHAPEKWLQGN